MVLSMTKRKQAMSDGRNRKSQAPCRLSVSMIVRNEESFLPGCLESLRGIVDEIVVVDTGSTDRTVDIARSSGAKVFFFDWIGDFSAARNESLRHCSGDWILYLDADERIAGESRDELRRIIEDPRVFAYNCLLRGEEWLPKGLIHNITPYPRLFRRLPEFRFEGKVHEQIVYSIQRNGYDVISSNVIIDHLGYAQPREVIVAKCERNVELLRIQLEGSPGDPYARFQLGNTLGMLSRHEEALSELQIALNAPGVPPRIKASILNSLATISVDENRLEDGMRYAEASLREAPHQVTARWVIVTLRMADQDYAGALPLLKEIVRIQRDPKRGERVELGFDATLPLEEVYFRLGLCLERTGAIKDAADAYYEGLRSRRDYRDMLERYAHCVDTLEDVTASLGQLKTLAGTAGESVLLQNLLVQCHLKRKDGGAAMGALRCIQEKGIGDSDTQGLAIELHLMNGDLAAAKKVYDTAMENGAESHRFHKAALQLLLLQNDLGRAMNHLEGMAHGVGGLQVKGSHFVPTLHMVRGE